MNELMQAADGKIEQQPPPTEEERLAIEKKCMALLARRAARYSMGDSTSLPEDTALRLLRSLRYVVGQCGLSPTALAAADWNTLYEQGLACLHTKLDQGRKLYLAAHATLPDVGNRSLKETMDEIADFFRRYDVRYFAAEIPCDIDYQLCCPVPEELCGIDYIILYLRRILIENDFLHRFSSQALIAFLEREMPEYRELILNLYEPVAAMAVGLTLAREPVEGLMLTQEGRQQIAQQFLQLQKAEADTELTKAAWALAGHLAITLPQGREYLISAARELRPRIMAALNRREAFS